jgi:hypothetical protein
LPHALTVSPFSISDPHADMNEGAMRRLTGLLTDLRYNLCVLTGDYRGDLAL